MAVEQMIVFLCVDGRENTEDGQTGIRTKITVDQIGKYKCHIMLF